MLTSIDREQRLGFGLQRDVDARIRESIGLLQEIKDPSISEGEIAPEGYLLGLFPRLTRFDRQILPSDVRLVRLPEPVQERLEEARNFYLSLWNSPESVLRRLGQKEREYRPPTAKGSAVMDEYEGSYTAVAFRDLFAEPPAPSLKRQSRTELYKKIEHPIMGEVRMPFALGSVPDVGSVEAYTTAAKAGVLALISRDKVLSDPRKQAQVAAYVLERLRSDPLPSGARPTREHLREFWQITGQPLEAFDENEAMQEYEQALRDYWVSNVFVAIEASEKGISRAELAYQFGVRGVRIYSPESGIEIPQAVAELRAREGFSSKDFKIIAGQVRHVEIAQAAEREGASAIMIGVAGGSQCTTSVKANLPVNTPNFLYRVRDKLNVPIGIEGGGVGTDMIVAAILGASFFSKPWEIGGSLEGAGGGEYALVDANGNYHMLYTGEASRPAKWWGGYIDGLGLPRFVEGEAGERILGSVRDDAAELSIAHNIHRLRGDVATGLAQQHVGSLEEFHQEPAQRIVRATENAIRLSTPYGQ